MDDVITCFDEVLDRLTSSDANTRADAAEAVVNAAGTDLDFLFGLLHAAYQRGLQPQEEPTFWSDKKWLPLNDGYRRGLACTFHTSLGAWVMPVTVGGASRWRACIAGHQLRRRDGAIATFATAEAAINAINRVMERMHLVVEAAPVS